MMPRGASYFVNPTYSYQKRCRIRHRFAVPNYLNVFSFFTINGRPLYQRITTRIIVNFLELYNFFPCLVVFLSLFLSVNYHRGFLVTGESIHCGNRVSGCTDIFDCAVRSVALFRKLLLLVSYDKPTNQRNCLSRSVEYYQDFGLRSE